MSRSGEFWRAGNCEVREQRKPFVTGWSGSPPSLTSRPSSTVAINPQASGQSRLQTVRSIPVGMRRILRARRADGNGGDRPDPAPRNTHVDSRLIDLHHSGFDSSSEK